MQVQVLSTKTEHKGLHAVDIYCNSIKYCPVTDNGQYLTPNAGPRFGPGYREPDVKIGQLSEVTEIIVVNGRIVERVSHYLDGVLVNRMKYLLLTRV